MGGKPPEYVEGTSPLGNYRLVEGPTKFYESCECASNTHHGDKHLAQTKMVSPGCTEWRYRKKLCHPAFTRSSFHATANTALQQSVVTYSNIVNRDHFVII